MMKIALITGASSGLGREFARQIPKLYQNLDEIWVVARRAERLNELEMELKVPVRIFDGDWNEIESWEVSEGEEYTATVTGSGVHHVKFECDGYLPFYLKDFGTGSFQIGSGDSLDTVTLVPGDTIWNEDNANQWSDDVINSSDL